MIRKSKPDGAALEKTVAKAVNYEVTVADLARKSQRRAWLVTMFSLFVTLIMAGAIFYMLPLKEREPYLVVLDPVTGNAQISRMVVDASDSWIYSNQSLTRSNLHRFIISRESYDYDLMVTSASGDWRLPFLMGTGSVTNELRALWANNNPQSPMTLYGRDKAIRVRINSIMLERAASPGKEGAATVRFQRLLFDKKSGYTRVIDSKIAMMEFTYNPNLKLGEADRVQNPLGFQVTTYRVENDGAAASLPPEIMMENIAPPDASQVSYPMPAGQQMVLPGDSLPPDQGQEGNDAALLQGQMPAAQSPPVQGDGLR